FSTPVMKILAIAVIAAAAVSVSGKPIQVTIINSEGRKCLETPGSGDGPIHRYKLNGKANIICQKSFPFHNGSGGFYYYDYYQTDKDCYVYKEGVRLDGNVKVPKC
ncbi:hypothetical protein GGI12_005758, partial [Dipsacomyces acuminosporus]